MFLVGNQKEYILLNHFKPLYSAFLHSIKLSTYRMGIKFDKEPSAVEQNNYLNKIGSVYIVYDLDAWPKNFTYNFNFKNCLFGETSVVKNSDKQKGCIAAME